jgi:hypothetical protein
MPPKSQISSREPKTPIFRTEEVCLCAKSIAPLLSRMSDLLNELKQLALLISTDKHVRTTACHCDCLPRNKPSWNRDARQLTWNGVVVREIKRPKQARNIVSILDAFETAGWPPRIDDPLERPSGDPNRRRDVENLNKRLLQPGVRFACDGTGTGFLWRGPHHGRSLIIPDRCG